MANQVLIVEDNPQAQNIFRKVLNNIGLNTVVKGQGDDAIEYLKINTPDIILLDMHLPVLDGQVVFDYVRTASHLTEAKVIIISADHKLSFSNHGNVHYVLIKPIQPRQLVILVRAILSEMHNPLPKIS